MLRYLLYNLFNTGYYDTLLVSIDMLISKEEECVDYHNRGF